MKTVIIHGQSHKGSTYHIAHELALKVGGEITEFFLPRDMGEFCIGCTQCFIKGETNCPHYEKIFPITKALNDADLIILESPVYVYHATGAMKAFLDHYGYRWMPHRPEEAMFSKQGVCISTAAGAGTKSANKDMSDSLFFWGVGKIYKLGFNVAAVSWETISEKKKKKIISGINDTANKLNKKYGKVKPGFKTKFFFNIMRMLQKKVDNPIDVKHWEDKGWLGKKRPWK